MECNASTFIVEVKQFIYMVLINWKVNCSLEAWSGHEVLNFEFLEKF